MLAGLLAARTKQGMHNGEKKLNYSLDITQNILNNRFNYFVFFLHL